MYSYLSERIAAASDFAIIRQIAPHKTSVLTMHLGSQFGNGRLLSRDEVAAIPLEALESAVSRALDEFPSWGKPKLPVTRVSPVQRLEDANNEVALREARKAAQHRGDQAPAAAAKAKLNALPAHLKLAAANGDPQLAHLFQKQK